MHWNRSLNSPWETSQKTQGYVKEIRWFHFPCLEKKKKKTAAVVFVGVNKCHGRNWSLCPWPAYTPWVRPLHSGSEHTVLTVFSGPAHQQQTYPENPADCKTSCFLIITLSLAVEDFFSAFVMRYGLLENWDLKYLMHQYNVDTYVWFLYTTNVVSSRFFCFC